MQNFSEYHGLYQQKRLADAENCERGVRTQDLLTISIKFVARLIVGLDNVESEIDA